MRFYTQKTEITKSDYFMLVGLLTVAKEHTKSLKIIEKAVAQLLGEKPDNGHAGDAVYGDYDADELLEKSEIKVVEDAAA